MADDADIEAGAVDKDLRLWFARESLRQGELRVLAQAASIQAMEARATALLGWCAAAGVAVVATFSHVEYRTPVACALASLFVAMLACVVGLWPREWRSAGYRRSQLISMRLATELEYTEAIAIGLERDAEINDGRLRSFARALRVAWGFLAATPAITLFVWAAAVVRL